MSTDGFTSIVTSKEPTPEFPALSIAVHITVVVPNGNVDPDVGMREAVVTPTLSVGPVA